VVFEETVTRARERDATQAAGRAATGERAEFGREEEGCDQGPVEGCEEEGPAVEEEDARELRRSGELTPLCSRDLTPQE